MSGCSFESRCPICGEELSCYSDHKPFDYSSGECLYCGFYYTPKTGQMTLDEVNDLRTDHNDSNGYKQGEEDYLEPLTQADLDEYKKEINQL